MDTVFKSIGILCITAYIMGLLTNLMPYGYTQKAIRLTVAVYIITSVLIPLKDFDFDINYYHGETDDYGIRAQEYILEETKNHIESNISRQLDEKSISYNRVEVHIHKQSEGIRIEKICIYGVAPQQRKNAENILNLGDILIFGE